jgi:ABC-type sugar transport system permease subunit
MIAISFFVVKNYRMTEAFEFVNWQRMLTRGYFWDSYWYTLFIASLSAAIAMMLAFPAAWALAFRASENLRRWAVFLLIIPFFHLLLGANLFLVRDPCRKWRFECHAWLCRAGAFQDAEHAFWNRGWLSDPDIAAGGDFANRDHGQYR